MPPHQIPEEIARFDAAVGSVRAELEALRANVPATAPAEFVGFIDVHLMILNDSMLSVEPRKIIETEQCNAEWALKVQMDALLAQFDADRGQLSARAPERRDPGRRARDESAARPSRLRAAADRRRTAS